jgi:hypothetical protein
MQRPLTLNGKVGVVPAGAPRIFAPILASLCSTWLTDWLTQTGLRLLRLIVSNGVGLCYRAVQDEAVAIMLKAADELLAEADKREKEEEEQQPGGPLWLKY